MPHNLFLHSNVVLSRRGDQGGQGGDQGGKGEVSAEPSRVQLRLALFYTRVETCAKP